ADVHRYAAIEVRAIHDADAGCVDIALDPGTILDLHGLLGLQVALDRSLHGNDLRLDAGFDDALRAHRDALGVGNRALDLAADQQLLVRVQFALEAQRRPDYRRPLVGRVIRISHNS